MKFHNQFRKKKMLTVKLKQPHLTRTMNSQPGCKKDFLLLLKSIKMELCLRLMKSMKNQRNGGRRRRRTRSIREAVRRTTRGEVTRSTERDMVVALFLLFLWHSSSHISSNSECSPKPYKLLKTLEET